MFYFVKRYWPCIFLCSKLYLKSILRCKETHFLRGIDNNRKIKSFEEVFKIINCGGVIAWYPVYFKLPSIRLLHIWREFAFSRSLFCQHLFAKYFTHRNCAKKVCVWELKACDFTSRTNYDKRKTLCLVIFQWIKQTRNIPQFTKITKTPHISISYKKYTSVVENSALKCIHQKKPKMKVWAKVEVEIPFRKTT